MNAKIQRVFGRLVLFGMVFHMVYSLEHFNLKGETYQLIRKFNFHVLDLEWRRLCQVSQGA